MRHYDLEASCIETFLSKSSIVFSWTKQNKSTFLLAQEGEKKKKKRLHLSDLSLRAGVSVLAADETGGSFEMQMAGAYRLSPVWSTLTPVAEMSLFKKLHCDVYRPTRQIGDDCSIVAVSEWEQGIHLLSERRLLSHLTNETPSIPPCLPHHHHHQHHPILLTSCLDLELLFKGMVYWCSLLPLLPMRRMSRRRCSSST